MVIVVVVVVCVCSHCFVVLALLLPLAPHHSYADGYIAVCLCLVAPAEALWAKLVVLRCAIISATEEM